MLLYIHGEIFLALDNKHGQFDGPRYRVERDREIPVVKQMDLDFADVVMVLYLG